MNLLFNSSTYNVESVDDALDIIDEFCIEHNMNYDDPHNDNGNLVIDLFVIDVDDEGIPHKTYQFQAVIRS